MSALPWMVEKLHAWLGGRGDWRLRMQAQWRWWVRRWAFAVVSCLLAWGSGGWWHAETWRAFAQTRQEVLSLQAQIAGLPQGPSVVSEVHMADVIRRLPAADELEQIWTLLQKTLAMHQVRLVSMQPVNEPWLAPLPSHAMALRLQARYENWAGLWSALARMGPVWSMDRLRVVPRTDGDGVDIEVVWRLWTRPQGTEKVTTETPLANLLTQLEAKTLSKGASVFSGVGVTPAGLAPVREAVGPAVGVLPAPDQTPDFLAPSGELIFSHEPERWPMRPLRVIGFWQHGDQTEAVLANATHWFRIREGRQLSLEGHRVWRVVADGIQIRDPQGRISTIRMEDRAP